MTAMAINFKQKPKEALEYFRGKGLKEQFSHLDSSAADHSRDFMVAKMMDLDLLSDVRSAVDDALNHGIAFDDFKKHLTEVLQEKGWWGKQDMIDPITGDMRTVQLGSPRRLKTIFDVNLSTSYAAGHWKKIADNSANQPYLMYNAIDDGRARPLHRSWDNKILRWDSPWWNTHYPPNGWRCRCAVIALSDDDLKEMGRTVDPDPEIKYRDWKNPRTGKTERIPEGIDPGWAHNVGQEALQKGAQNTQITRQFIEKAAVAPARLGAAVIRTVNEPVMDALNASWKTFFDGFDIAKTRGESVIAGFMSPATLDALAELAITPSTAAITMDDYGLAHALRKENDKTAQGKPKGIHLSELNNLPDLLTFPQAVLLDEATETLIYVFAADRRPAGKLVVRVSYKNKKTGETYPRIQSGGLLEWLDVEKDVTNGKLITIEGEL